MMKRIGLTLLIAALAGTGCNGTGRSLHDDPVQEQQIEPHDDAHDAPSLPDAEIPSPHCAAGRPAGGSCLCGQTAMSPADAAFWTCVDDEWICYRKNGCYVDRQKVSRGAVFRQNEVWCGEHKNPGGDYRCAWDAAAQELRWKCTGSCRCGDISVQVVDGAVVSGDLPYGTENFTCDDGNGRGVFGYLAESGDELCDAVPMIKGQVCHDGEIYCGDRKCADHSFDSSYECIDGRMVCIDELCECDDIEIVPPAECWNGEVMCLDSARPENGAYTCTPRGWVCTEKNGCPCGSGTTPAYGICRDGMPVCGHDNVPENTSDFACVNDRLICQNPRGCRFLPGGPLCRAAFDGENCIPFNGYDDTTIYSVRHTIANDRTIPYRPTVSESTELVCAQGKQCPCGDNLCTENMQCAGGQCTCLNAPVSDPRNVRCITSRDTGLLIHKTNICSGTPCDGICHQGKCVPIRGSAVKVQSIDNTYNPSPATWMCSDPEACFYPGVGTVRYGESFPYSVSLKAVFLYAAEQFGWQECIDDARWQDDRESWKNVRAIINATPERYRCGIEEAIDYTTVHFTCRDTECSCGGLICQKDDVCTDNTCYRGDDGEKPRRRPKCGSHKMKFGESCRDGMLYCRDFDGRLLKYPGSSEKRDRYIDYRCEQREPGRRSWYGSHNKSMCGGILCGTACECVDDEPMCGGRKLPAEGYRCRDRKSRADWVCENPLCACGSRSCPKNAVCRDGACICSGIPMPTGEDWICTENGWQCENTLGCSANGTFCAHKTLFDGVRCLCGGTQISGTSVCTGTHWICSDPDGCICRGFNIRTGEICRHDSFVRNDIGEDGKRDRAFAKTKKDMICGSHRCPPNTKCFNGQCLFQATDQQLPYPSQYTSVRGFPRCADKNGCMCGDSICRPGYFCRNNTCLKYPTYGTCGTVTVPVNRITAAQYWRQHIDNMTNPVWRSLFETSTSKPIGWYDTTRPLIQFNRDDAINALYNFYFQFDNPDTFEAEYCTTAPDIEHIDEYELWFGTGKGKIWDDAVIGCTIEDELENRSLYTYNPDRRDHILELIKQEDDHHEYAKEILSSEAIGWVCAQNSGCSCGTVRCDFGEKCTRKGNKTFCSPPTFTVPVPDNTFISQTPYYNEGRLDDFRYEYDYDGLSCRSISLDMSEEGYHEYKVCTDDDGCICGSGKCFKDGACVDKKYCRYSSPVLKSKKSVIPYMQIHCPGADDADADGRCLFWNAAFPPDMFIFDHALGAQCITDSCVCGEAVCRRGQWCRRGVCVTGSNN